MQLPLELFQYEDRYRSAMLRAFGGSVIAASDQVIAAPRGPMLVLVMVPSIITQTPSFEAQGIVFLLIIGLSHYIIYLLNLFLNHMSLCSVLPALIH